MDIRELGDRTAIRQLVDRFSLAVTLRDAPALAALLVTDAQWSVIEPVSMAFSGAENIAAGIVGGLNNFEFLVQMAHSVVIDVNGDRAVARSVIEEVGRAKGGGAGVQILGVYHDELQRGAQGWQFIKRTFRPINIDSTAPGGAMVGTGTGKS